MIIIRAPHLFLFLCFFLVAKEYSIETKPTQVENIPAQLRTEFFVLNITIFTLPPHTGENLINEAVSNLLASFDVFEDVWQANEDSIKDFLYQYPEYLNLAKVAIFYIIHSEYSPETEKPFFNFVKESLDSNEDGNIFDDFVVSFNSLYAKFQLDYPDFVASSPGGDPEDPSGENEPVCEKKDKKEKEEDEPEEDEEPEEEEPENVEERTVSDQIIEIHDNQNNNCGTYDDDDFFDSSKDFYQDDDDE